MLCNVFNPFASAYQILDDIEDWQQDHARERCNYLSLLSKDFSEYHDADVYRVAFDDVETLLANSECNESQLPSELIGLMAPFTLRLKLKMQALQREHTYD
jgi:hypothetical protein